MASDKLHLYSIVPLDSVDEHLEDICQDIRSQYETGVSNMALAMMTLVNPGDEVILPDPAYTCYEGQILRRRT